MNKTFQEQLIELINNHTHHSNTPDFILATYMWAVLVAYNDAVIARENWHGTKPTFYKTDE